MFQMRSMKAKIILMVISALVMTMILVLSVTGIIVGKQIVELSTTCLSMKLSGDIQSSRDYLKACFGSLKYENNRLIDSNNNPIDNSFEFVDSITSKLGVVATVFVKDDDAFRRVITSVRNNEGERVIGTKLGKSSAAYNSIIRKEIYIGRADILGKPYLTIYDPIVDDKNDIIGILFLGITFEQINNTIKANFRSLISISLLLTVIAITIAVFLLLFVINKQFLPLRNILLMLKDISEGEGDLTKRLNTESNDETGELSAYFNKFVEKLQMIIGKITGNANTVASSAIGLSTVSAQIAANAEEMSKQTSSVASNTTLATANINTISSAAEEMSSSANTVASAIEEMSLSLNEVAQNCQKELRIATEANEHAKNSKEIMDKLGFAANSIGRVVEVIKDIADQTNLLALNATIEAAAAGEAGRGFSVVANEVKALALQTAKATHEIQKQIKEMQTNTESAVKAIESVSKVIGEVNLISQTIVSAVEQQSATINEISRSVSGVSTSAQEVSKNVTKSANGLSEISTTITDVNKAVTDTAEGIVQIKTSAEELSKLSEGLKGLLSQFKI